MVLCCAVHPTLLSGLQHQMRQAAQQDEERRQEQRHKDRHARWAAGRAQREKQLREELAQAQEALRTAEQRVANLHEAQKQAGTASAPPKQAPPSGAGAATAAAARAADLEDSDVEMVEATSAPGTRRELSGSKRKAMVLSDSEEEVAAAPAGGRPCSRASGGSRQRGGWGTRRMVVDSSDEESEEEQGEANPTTAGRPALAERPLAGAAANRPKLVFKASLLAKGLVEVDLTAEPVCCRVSTADGPWETCLGACQCCAEACESPYAWQMMKQGHVLAGRKGSALAGGAHCDLLPLRMPWPFCRSATRRTTKRT